ncbi:MAG: PEGA domain-containing protein, partial [Trueperaceae bacterium]|nr:PEGA domain-containing protein [Trueperaceae bacterium]
TARFEAPGYQSSTVRFTVQSGRDQTVNSNMTATLGTVVVQANVGGALVFLDGRQVGTIPNGTGRLTLPNIAVGTHELVVIAPGYATYITSFSISPGRTVELSVRQSRF